MSKITPTIGTKGIFVLKTPWITEQGEQYEVRPETLGGSRVSHQGRSRLLGQPSPRERMLWRISRAGKR